MLAIYPYTVTNSQKGGFFMRSYSRNVRRAWDGDDYHAPKRQRLDGSSDVERNTLASSRSADYAVEDTLERAIRETSVAALSSSPSRKNSMYSLSENHEPAEPETLTPPSSPPHILDITPPVLKVRKPTFSSLQNKKNKEKNKAKEFKRKRDDETTQTVESRIKTQSDSVGTGVESQAQASSTFTAINRDAINPEPLLHRSESSGSRSFTTQSILDFGQSLAPIECSQCKMSYMPWIADDNAQHERYHNRHKRGIELSTAFIKSALRWGYIPEEVEGKPQMEGLVVPVDRTRSLPVRKCVQNVLEVVNRELGSVDISEEELWSQVAIEGAGPDAKKERYKVFLHVIDDKCVGVCLVERISKGYKVVSTQPPRTTDHTDFVTEPKKEVSAILTPQSSNASLPHASSSADLIFATEPTKVAAGISRLWVSKRFRNRGIAKSMLDFAKTGLNNNIQKLNLDEKDFAFSQPTDAGAALAKHWFQSETGWCVYREE